MKKLSLKNLKLEADNMLERNQLKTVFGGNYEAGYGRCVAESRCSNGCATIKRGKTYCNSCCIA